MGLSLFSFLRTRARTTPLKRRINQRIIVLQRLVRGARGDSGLWAMDINPETGKDPAVERVKSSVETVGLALSEAVLKLTVLLLPSAAIGSARLLGVVFREGMCVVAPSVPDAGTPSVTRPRCKGRKALRYFDENAAPAGA